MSSSSSSSSDDESTSSTGSFSSSGESLSDASTIVPPEPCPLPQFGEPKYNYFWIENKSRSNPRLSYYYNFKSHAVVWSRPVSRSTPIPCYTSWVPGRKDLSEDEEAPVSDFEDDLQRKKRVAVKRRNRRLAIEDRDNEIEVLSVKKTVRSRRMLETFWKLHRFPGETLKDMKQRLLETSASAVGLKTEELDAGCGPQDPFNNLSIKKEPVFEANGDAHGYKSDAAEQAEQAELDALGSGRNEQIDDSVVIEGLHNEPVKDEDFDSDPDNVSFLIKQEYLNNYGSTDEESRDEVENDYGQRFSDEGNVDKDSDDEDDIFSEESDDEYEDECENGKFIVNPMYDKFNKTKLVTDAEVDCNDRVDFEYNNSEAAFIPADLLDVEINEDDGTTIFIPDDSITNDNSLMEETINWTFDKSFDNTNNSSLTSSAINSIYRLPELRRISKQKLFSSKMKRNKKEEEANKKIPKLIIRTSPTYHIKQPASDPDTDEPIVCDMYGTRTLNYNHPPKVKAPRWQSYSRLSDSDVFSDDSNGSERPVPKLRLKLVNPFQNVVPNEHLVAESRPTTVLELKNWFPKKRKNKRKLSARSNSSWCESDVSDYSEVDDVTATLVKIKRERKSSSSEKEPCETSSDLEEEESKSLRLEQEEHQFKTIYENVVKHIKQEKVEDYEGDGMTEEVECKPEREELTMRATPPVPDLSLVKVERYSDSQESVEEPKPTVDTVNTLVAEPKEESNSDAEGNSSSSSSSSCSRSSCSCCSSSSSSSDEGTSANVNGDQPEPRTNEDL